MEKRICVFLFAMILVAAVSGTLGYVSGYYVEGLQHVNDMEVRVHSHILLLDSLALLRLSDLHGIPGLIDAVELSCVSHASFIQAYEPYSPADTKKRISEALETWEKAKRKLKELRSLSVRKTQESGAVEKLQQK